MQDYHTNGKTSEELIDDYDATARHQGQSVPKVMAMSSGSRRFRRLSESPLRMYAFRCGVDWVPPRRFRR